MNEACDFPAGCLCTVVTLPPPFCNGCHGGPVGCVQPHCKPDGSGPPCCKPVSQTARAVDERQITRPPPFCDGCSGGAAGCIHPPCGPGNIGPPCCIPHNSEIEEPVSQVARAVDEADLPWPPPCVSDSGCFWLCRKIFKCLHSSEHLDTS